MKKWVNRRKTIKIIFFYFLNCNLKKKCGIIPTRAAVVFRLSGLSYLWESINSLLRRKHKINANQKMSFTQAANESGLSETETLISAFLKLSLRLTTIYFPISLFLPQRTPRRQEQTQQLNEEDTIADI